MTELPDRADIVVLGAGYAGAATASALARAGVAALVLERHARPGGEASGRNAGMIREDASDAAVEVLTSRGAAAHRSGRLGPFRQTGSFLIGRGDEDVSRHVPPARGRGRFQAADGVTDPHAVLAGLLEGLDVRHGVVVDGVEPARDLFRLKTDAGDVLARTVVNAAGAWAGRLGNLPLHALKRHVFRVKPPATAGDVSPDWPFVWDVDADLYFRPAGDENADAEHVLACACDEREGPPGDNLVEDEASEELAAKLGRLQPGLSPCDVEDGWAGQRTFAPDRRPVIGWDPRSRGLFWVAALGGHGLTAAPAVGELAAELLLQGPDAEPVRELRPFAPARLLRA